YYHESDLLCRGYMEPSRRMRRKPSPPSNKCWTSSSRYSSGNTTSRNETGSAKSTGNGPTQFCLTKPAIKETALGAHQKTQERLLRRPGRGRMASSNAGLPARTEGPRCGQAHCPGTTRPIDSPPAHRRPVRLLGNDVVVR